MPTHKSIGYDADALDELVKHVEGLGEDIVSVVSAGNVWAVVTKRPASKPAKTTTSVPRKAVTR